MTSTATTSGAREPNEVPLSKAEEAALVRLRGDNLADGWFSWAPGTTNHEGIDAEPDAKVRDIDRECRRLQRACGQLYKRGIVARRRCWAGGFEYRLTH